MPEREIVIKDLGDLVSGFLWLFLFLLILDNVFPFLYRFVWFFPKAAPDLRWIPAALLCLFISGYRFWRAIEIGYVRG